MQKPSNILLQIALGFAVVPAIAQTVEPKFSIKDHEARTGSKFRRDVIQSTKIPLNLPYEKFSEAQRSELKSHYESMGADDEPPFPAAGLTAIMSEVHEAQNILQVQGNMRLHATVSASGKVTSVAFLESVDPRFDLYVAGILVRTKFKPAKCAGEPCTQDYEFAWSFTLEPR